MKKSNVNLMFRAFSDRTRLRILHLLLKGEICVCDLVSVTRVPQPTASRHLAYLRRAGLILGRRDGLWNYYRLAPVKTAFHRSLIQCLKECFRDVREISGDDRRAAKACVCCVPPKGKLR
jgi:ArsR family transcriptional regulator